MTRWHARNFFRGFLISTDGKETVNKLKIFTYSILFGLSLILIILEITYGNAFVSLFGNFAKLFSSDTNIERWMLVVATLGLAGIAVAVGFKTGLFNIGVSGQMMMAGLVSGLVAFQIGSSLPAIASHITVVIIAIIAGAAFAMIAGILKTLFNIHEVVTTILLNWLAFYLYKYTVADTSAVTLVSSGLSSVPFNEAFSFTINGFRTLPALIILVAVAGVVWFIFKKTTFGHSLVMVGKNKDAAKYAGINVKFISISSMGLSGGIAGVLGVMVYFISKGEFDVPLGNVVPAEGFNGIAIALLAFSNPMAILFVSLLFGSLRQLIATSLTIDQNFITLIYGLLMFISSIGIAFIKLDLLNRTRLVLYGKRYVAEFIKYRLKKEVLDQMYLEQLATKKQKFKEEFKAYMKDHKSDENFSFHKNIEKSKFKDERDILMTQHILAIKGLVFERSLALDSVKKSKLKVKTKSSKKGGSN